MQIEHLNSEEFNLNEVTDMATKYDIPQQGSQKSRKHKGLEADPGVKDTAFKKHWNQNHSNNK